MGPKKSIILTGLSYYPNYHLIRIWFRNNNRDKEGENRDRKKISYYPDYRIKQVSSYPDSTVLSYKKIRSSSTLILKTLEELSSVRQNNIFNLTMKDALETIKNSEN